LKSPQEDGPGKALTGRWIEEERNMKKVYNPKKNFYSLKRQKNGLKINKCVFFFTNYFMH
jgi:hypothetical protein